MGGLKTESAKFHEILTSVCVWGGSKTFLYPPQIVSVGGGLKTETGKFLLHFQSSKSSNRCRSVYGTDITIYINIAESTYFPRDASETHWILVDFAFYECKNWMNPIT